MYHIKAGERQPRRDSGSSKGKSARQRDLESQENGINSVK
jgi:hypothetical protein